MKTLDSILLRVENLGIWVGKLASWLLPILILCIVYNVFMRYALNAPTIWSFDISYMLGGAMYLLGLAWVHQKDENVRVDIISARFPQRTRTVIDLALNFILFFPFVLFVFLTSLRITIHSWKIQELASTTIFYPPLYPLRTIITIGLLLLLLQGVVNVARSLRLLIKGANNG
ncbi:MAG: TRAP transporter small permease subunit [Dehalococcoidia bacterium]|nr:TRAP transporter small permease subunit [Dehalococcoidia bacterium]